MLFIMLAGMVCGVVLANDPRIEVYPDRGSYTPGDTVELHVSTNVTSLRVEAFRLGVSSVTHVLAEGLTAGDYGAPASDGWKTDFRWPVSAEIDIPEDWEPGFYQFTLRNEADLEHTTRFELAIYPEERGSYGKVAVLTNDSTNMAYNKAGGKSNYQGSRSMTYNRPGNYKSSNRELYFPFWADNIGMPVEYMTSVDLHFGEDILDAYDVLVLHGHSEYWSREMRWKLEAFLDRGGKLVSLSGNTMWWSVRFDHTDEGLIMISCKNSNWATVCPDDPDLNTGYWHLQDPEIKVLGVSWKYGGYVDSHGFYPKSEGYGGYFAESPLHWFWAGTGVLEGDHVGQDAGIAGYEADGPALEINANGKLVLAPHPDRPANLIVLGTTPAASPKWEGYGAIVYFPYGDNGGEVFNCGSTDCAYGLASDPIWSKAILNVFVKFGAISYSLTDWDSDGIDDCNDNCIAIPNKDQLEDWGDGTGNVCDVHCH